MKARGISLTAPSTVLKGEKFSLGVKILTDPYPVVAGGCWSVRPSFVSPFNFSSRGFLYTDDALPDFKGNIEFSGGSGYKGPSAFSFADGKGPLFNDTRAIRRITDKISFDTSGIKYISCIQPESGVTGISNPIHVYSNEAELEEGKLFWGDIHCHTFFTDGLRCPEELHLFAKDEAFLDIFALSDHSEWISDRQWDYFANVAKDFYNPGSFVTLIGQEWTNHKCGHRNIYYPGDYGPVVRSTDRSCSTLEGLYTIVSKHKGMLIPHHSANTTMGVDWSRGYNGEIERLVEIYSCWGSSEMPASMGNKRPIRHLGGEKKGQHVIDALLKGYRFGFTGSGDIHDGRPGDYLKYSDNETWQQGIMGVWAKELTREAVFEALYNRRVYATTNVRIFLKFSIGGHPMGSETVLSGEVPISIEAASEIPISMVEIIKNNELIYTSKEFNNREIKLNLKQTISSKASFYYVRVTRADGEMAWSSPIWIN